MGLFTGILDRSALRGLNRAGQGLADAEKGASVLGKAHAVGGKILGSTLGGGLLGGAGNAALYANNQQGIGGSFNMGDAFMTGAAGGALLGGIAGIGGARATAAAAKGDVVRATAKFEKATKRAKARGFVGRRTRAKTETDWRERVPNTSTRVDNAKRLTPTQSRALTNAGNAKIRRQSPGYQNAIMTKAQNPIQTAAARKNFSLRGSLPRVDMRTEIPYQGILDI